MPGHLLKGIVLNEIVLGTRLKALAQLFIKLFFAWKNGGDGTESEREALEEMAKAFGVKSEWDTLSQAWFDDLAKQYNIEIPTEGRPPHWY